MFRRIERIIPAAAAAATAAAALSACGGSLFFGADAAAGPLNTARVFGATNSDNTESILGIFLAHRD